MGFVWDSMKNAALDAIPIYGSIRKYRRAKARWQREKEREAAAVQARAQNSDTIPAAAFSILTFQHKYTMI